MPNIVPEEKARQGRWGVRVLFVLAAALFLVMIAWAGAEYYGQSIDNSTPAVDTVDPG